MDWGFEIQLFNLGAELREAQQARFVTVQNPEQRLKAI